MSDYIAEMAAKQSHKANALADEQIEGQVKELGGWPALEGLADQIGVGLQRIGLNENHIDALIGGEESSAVDRINALSHIIKETSYSDIPGSPGQPAIIDNNFLLDRMKKSETMPMLEKDEFDKETQRLYAQAYPG